MVDEKLVDVIDKRVEEKFDSLEQKTNKIYDLLGGDKFENGLCKEVKMIKEKLVIYDRIIWMSGGIIVAMQFIMPFVMRFIFK